ncbi:MAG: ABC transporter permease subunit [Bacteroidales bacterium]|nr:ABC transporter permease subunit [Bacteroidales bacterium]
MKKLLSLEKIKALSYPTFKTLMIIHFLLFFLVVLVVSRIHFSIPGFSVKGLYQFPNIWEFFPWVASWFNIFLTIVLITLVGNEFSFKTFRQNVIDGLSRNDLIKGKLILIFTIAVYTFLMVLIAVLIFGIIFTKEFSMNIIFENSYLILVYFVQAIGYMTLGLLFAVIFRNNALSIILFLVYFPVEGIIRLFFKSEYRAYFPLKIISNLTPKPEFLTIASEQSYTNASGNSSLDFSEMGILPEDLPLGITLAMAAGYIGFFIALATVLLNRRSL